MTHAERPGAEARDRASGTECVGNGLGAVKGNDPRTGHPFDDTKRYVDGTSLSTADKQKIFEGNARKVFSDIRSFQGPVFVRTFIYVLIASVLCILIGYLVAY